MNSYIYNNHEELRIPEMICEYLNGSGSVFLPETWRDGAACVSMTGGHEIYREYVDGSYIAGMPFDIRVRTPRGTHNSIADKLDVASFYAALAEYIRTTPLTPASDTLSDFKILPMAGGTPYKSAVYDDGAEEYRAGYMCRFFVKGQAPSES